MKKKNIVLVCGFDKFWLLVNPVLTKDILVILTWNVIWVLWCSNGLNHDDLDVPMILGKKMIFLEFLGFDM